MRLRQYSKNDFSYLAKWVNSERIHALWCANSISYPMTQESFHALLEKNAAEWGDSVFLATEDDGQPVGFFSYSVNIAENSGFLKYVVLDSELRGKGYGTQMLTLALRYAFEITGVDFVQINVFDVNEAARKCYARIGFSERRVTENALTFHGETWKRHNLTISGIPNTKNA